MIGRGRNMNAPVFDRQIELAFPLHHGENMKNSGRGMKGEVQSVLSKPDSGGIKFLREP